MPRNDEAKLPIREVLAEAILSHRADGRTVPTLMITTRTYEGLPFPRFSRAMALWSAAHAELMLERRGDLLWEVCFPRRSSHQTKGGAKWAIHLEPIQEEADVGLAMRALRDVTRTLGDMFGVRDRKKGPGLT